MNRGFIAYFKEAFSASISTIYKKKGFLWVWLYMIMSFVGRLFFLGPMFDLANVRNAKTVHAYHSLNIPQNFREASKAHTIWALICAYLIEAMIALGGMILIGIGTGLLAIIGLIVSYAVPDFEQIYMILIFCSPGAFVYLAYLSVLPVLFAPTAYIVESNPGISAAAAVSASVQTMKRNGKLTGILNFLVLFLVIAVLGGIGALAIILIDENLMFEDYYEIVRYSIIFVYVAILLLVLPIFILTFQISQKSLFEDISLDPVNASKHTAGLNIKRCRGVLFKPETIEENLSVLFDETQDDSVPLPTSEARKKEDEYRRAGDEKADLSGEEVHEEKK